MAKILNKDPVTYQKERDAFLRELHQFHDGRGTPFRQVPRLHGHEVDLYLLYVLVTAHGGWEKVNQRSEWETLLEQFTLPSCTVNGGVALKQVYVRYLERYERVHFLGEVGDQDEDPEDGHRRWAARAVHNVPSSYNYHHHNISDAARSNIGLSTNLFKPTEYDRLALSLLSPLPNEQDYAINVCTLLSNEGKHTLKLERCPRLIDLLLAHAGVFAEGSLRDVFLDMFRRSKNHSTRRFWSDVIEEKDFLELTEPPPVKEFYCLPPTPASLPDLLMDSELLPEEHILNKEELPDRASKPPSVVPECGTDCEMIDLSEAQECAEQFPSSDVQPQIATDSPDPDLELDALSAVREPPLAIDERSCLDEESKNEDESERHPVDDECKIEGAERPEEEVVVPVEKPKIRMIDVPEDEIPQLPKQDSKSLFWCDPVDYSKMPPLEEFMLNEDRDLFCLGRVPGVDDLLGQRVLQVATILRNLCFEEENIPVLCKNQSFMRFAMMCTQSKCSRLMQMGMDMISQIAGELVLEDPQTDTMAAMLMSTVTKGLSSPDRFMIISCLETLNKLSQNEVNEELMLKLIEQKVYEQVCTFLTLHDIMLLIYTLECLYSLTSLGEKACNSICRVHGAIDTLVSLITVEAQSYGPRACILMRVVERVPEHGNVVHHQSSSSMMSVPQSASPQLTQLTTMNATPASQSTVITKQLGTPQRPVQGQNQAQPTTTIVIQAPQQLIQQQHQQQQQIQENEQFALSWLRSNYEHAAGATLDQTEMYHQYISSCAKIGRRGVVTSYHFPRFVRTVFGGSVGPNPKPTATPGANAEFQYVGIKVRASGVPLVTAGPSVTTTTHVASHQQPTPPPAPVAENAPITPATAGDPALNAVSPILKAQLSAPSKPGVKVDSKSQVMAHPHLTQALLGNAQHPAQRPSSAGSPSPASTSHGATSSSCSLPQPSSSTPSNTSLIKSLLASKVNTAPSVTTSTSVVESMSMSNAVTTSSATNTSDIQQVAQRQQRLMQQQQQVIKTVQQQTIASSTNAIAPPQVSSPPPLQPITPSVKMVTTIEQPAVAKVNGSRNLMSPDLQVENSMDTTDNHVKSNALLPPPPPKSTKIDEDSNSAASTGNSVVSSGGGLSTDGDGDNSLTSFEGILLNGVPHNLDIDNESSEEVKPAANGGTDKPKAKGMLADLLEKKVASKEPIINGVIGKELRISDKGLELVENSLDAAPGETTTEQTKQGLKRPAPSPPLAVEAKKICLPQINGEVKSDSEAFPDSKIPEPVSTAPAQHAIITPDGVVMTTAPTITTQAQMMVAPRQIIMGPSSISSLQPGQVVLSQAGTQMKTQMLVQQAGQRQVLVQNQQPMLINSSVGGGQLLLTQNNGQTYVMAPSQGLPQGQTFLVAQSPQQQGTNTKTIIILHQQGQKMGTPGQPMMVQLPRSAIQGGASGLQGLMLSQGAGGQMTVSLPGCNPIIARPMDPSNGNAQQIVKAVVGQQPTMMKAIVSTAVVAATTTSTQPPPLVSSSTSATAVTTTVMTPTVATATPQPAAPLPVSPYVCEWRGCMRIFKSANEVYMHACQSHCPTGPEDVQCLWERCDNLKRKRFSLMTHLYDRHCNNETMKAMAARRKQMALSGKSEIPAPTPPPQHPGYAPNAALHAIKRHALEFVNPKELMQRAAAGSAVAATASTSVTPSEAAATPSLKTGPPAPQVSQNIRPVQQPAETNPSRRLSFQDDNEGPVTKSIRLTSSLILRNLVIYSNAGKRHLRSYEPHLASIALSNVESSRTIAQVLYDMNQTAANQS